VSDTAPGLLRDRRPSLVAPGTQLALSQNPAPDEDHSPAFWKSVAATFKGDTA